jgi:hypothetical protein
MPALGFTDQRTRLRRILENSLEGALYDSSVTEEDGRVVVLHAHRPDGERVSVRFLAVTSSDATEEPQPGAYLTVRGVDVRQGGCLSLLMGFAFFLAPRPRAPVAGSARVRIDAGSARLDIVCQDAEWWEDAGSR